MVVQKEAGMFLSSVEWSHLQVPERPTAFSRFLSHPGGSPLDDLKDFLVL